MSLNGASKSAQKEQKAHLCRCDVVSGASTNQRIHPAWFVTGDGIAQLSVSVCCILFCVHAICVSISGIVR